MFTPTCGFLSKPTFLGSWMKTSGCTCEICNCLWHQWNMIFKVPNNVLGVSQTSFVSISFHIESFQLVEMRQENFGCVLDLLTMQSTCQWSPKCILPPSALPFIYRPLGKPKPICFSFIYTLLIKMLVLVGFLCFPFKKPLWKDGWVISKECWWP